MVKNVSVCKSISFDKYFSGCNMGVAKYKSHSLWRCSLVLNISNIVGSKNFVVINIDCDPLYLLNKFRVDVLKKVFLKLIPYNALYNFNVG